MRDDVTMEYSSIYYLHTAWRAMLKDIELILTQVYYIYYIGLFLIVYKWFYDWNRLKAAILGLWFVKSMMFNCGNPREPKGTSLGESLVTPGDSFLKMMQMK